MKSASHTSITTALRFTCCSSPSQLSTKLFKQCRCVRRNTRRIKNHFFRALAASCVLYNRTEHSQGLSICFMIKNLLNSPCITFNFQNKLYFQS